MSNCNCHTEINRDGSGQLSRYLQALDPSYVHIDDRSIADLLVFAKRYAAQIRFYDIPGSMQNEHEDKTKVSWREFFRRDLAVVVASIGLVDVKQVKTNYDELREKIDRHPVHNLYAELFSPIIGMAARIDKWYTLAIPGNPLHTELDLAIASDLRPQVQKIREFENGFLSVDAYHPLKLDYTAILNKDLWGLNDSVGADPGIYTGDTIEEKIRKAALFIDDIFHAFYGFIIHLIHISGDYLKRALEEYPTHQPHMALFISFLRLFNLAQQQMNGLTERMLNFYYRDVLHLTEKPSIPDHAFIIFELAKDVVRYQIAQGTALKAGKDDFGKEQIYETTSELVINEAKVKELKTIFIDKTDGKNSRIKAIYARPVANSADGFGEKFTDPSKKWPTFGKGSPRPSAVKNICQAIDQYVELTNRKDQAQIGFAIASPQLVLQSGNRLIKCHLQNFSQFIGNKPISIWLTSEEGWNLIDIEQPKLPGLIVGGKFDTKDVSEKSYYFDKDNDTLFIFLPIAEKAIISFDKDLHKEFFFPSSYPVMQIMVGPGIGMTSNNFNKLKCNSINLEVQVGSINPFDDPGVTAGKLPIPNMDGLTTLFIKNDDGIVAPGTPFDPFTAFPQKGSQFYIGSDEVFNKPVDELTINIELVSELQTIKEEATEFSRVRDNESHGRGFLAVSVLAKGRWTKLSTKEGSERFTLDELTQNILKNNSGVLIDRQPIINNEDVTNSSFKGFISIRNLFEFNQGIREKNFFELMQQLAKLLKIRQVSLSYHSHLAQLDQSTDQLFHVYPFGAVETYFGSQPTNLSLGPVKNSQKRTIARKASSFTDRPELLELDEEKEYLLVDAKQKLLPQFTYTSPYTIYDRGSVDIDEYKKLLGAAKIDWNAEIVPKMIEASGLKEKAEGKINQYWGELQEEGMLFIGLENLKPLQTISLLFQFAEGSAEDEDSDPPPIHWSYLSNNEWIPLKDEDIRDGTEGFRATGIINIDVPADASTHNTIMTDGLVWFCASVGKDSRCIPMLVDVIAQAVEVEFTDKGNAPSHFDAALPAGKISKLETAVAEISRVDQPFSSFDGKPREIGKEFYTRVSERLRHKGRAITAWDYEHLILARFPSIYKVKCITHTDPNCFCRPAVTKKLSMQEKYEEADATDAVKSSTKTKPGDTAAGPDVHDVTNVVVTGYGTKLCCGPQVAPGHVLIIPIADLKNRNAVNKLQPKTSRRTILEIEKYIKARTSPFVKVHVRNPLYEEVLVYFKVKFQPGRDKGYHLKKLNEEIVHYLTPWAFKADQEVKFGEKIYASSVINFIEEREYVDFIVDFLMFVCRDECCPPVYIKKPGKQNNELNITADVKINSVAGKPVSITGLLTDKSGAGVEGITIEEKGVENGAISDVDGKFSLLLKGDEMQLIFQKGGYEPLTLTVEADKIADLLLKQVPSNLSEEVVVSYNQSGIVPDKLDSNCGCSEIEYVLDNAPAFVGETVIAPSTQRSILVSVPQHIIIPFEEEPRPSPCDERRMNGPQEEPYASETKKDSGKKVAPKKAPSKKGSGKH